MLRTILSTVVLIGTGCLHLTAEAAKPKHCIKLGIVEITSKTAPVGEHLNSNVFSDGAVITVEIDRGLAVTSTPISGTPHCEYCSYRELNHRYSALCGRYRPNTRSVRFGNKTLTTSGQTVTSPKQGKSENPAMRSVPVPTPIQLQIFRI